MKKMFFALLLFSASLRAMSQCSPDTTINFVGFYPMDTLLPCIEQGIYFDETLLFKNFSQVNFPGIGLVIIDTVIIDSVKNMPPGISYACNTPGCLYTSGENGCVRLSGTTNAAPGVYNLGFYATLKVTFSGIHTTFQADSLFLAQNGLGYRLIVTNQGGFCPNSEPGQLFFNASIVTPVFCEGDTVSLHTLTSGGATPYVYSWSPSTNLSDSSAYNPLLYPTNPGTYRVTVTDDNGLTAVDSVNVEYSDAPVVSISPDATICPGESEQLVASGGTSYSWSPSAGLSATDISNPFASPVQTTTYMVTVSIGNCSGTADVTVIVDTSSPVAAFTDISTNLDVLFTNISTDAESYWWDFGDGDTSIETSPQHRYSAGGNYDVVLVATNSCGVADTITQTVNLSVGIADRMNDKMLKVLPNPSTGLFQLEIEGLSEQAISWQVTSVCGEILEDETVSSNARNSFQLDLTGFPKGIYFLKVVAGEKTGFKKIIIE